MSLFVQELLWLEIFDPGGSQDPAGMYQSRIFWSQLSGDKDHRQQKNSLRLILLNLSPRVIGKIRKQYSVGP